MRFGMMLVRRRKELHLTQLALAKKSGVAQGYISDLEAGRKDRPSMDVAVKLARVLNVDLSNFLYRLDKPKPRRRRSEFKRRNR